MYHLVSIGLVPRNNIRAHDRRIRCKGRCLGLGGYRLNFLFSKASKPYSDGQRGAWNGKQVEMMKVKLQTLLVLWMSLAWFAAAFAAPMRVALVDFEDESGLSSDPRLGGAIEPGALARKGALLLGKRIAANPDVALIDRRDFTRQLTTPLPPLADGEERAMPSVIHAAQALRADTIIRGSILSFSTGKQVIRQGGHAADISRVTLRVSLEAMSALDGEVIAIADAAAQIPIRQTPEVETFLSEDEVLGLMEEAIGDSYAQIGRDLAAWQAAREARPTVRLTVTTDADPALVEIDGILVGTSPLTDYAIYQGDHVLRIGKPGYRDLTKRILFEQDTAIEVPMLKTQLNADEAAEVLKTIRLHVFQGEPGLVIHNIGISDE